jgi:hypothetical protein
VNEQLLIGIIKLLSDSETREGKSEYIHEIREIAEELEPHFDEDYPKKLLRVQHPGEQDWMKIYRKERWQPKTRTATGRVYTTLQKIQQADDFKILFKNDFKDIGISESNPKGLPSKYCLENLPKFGSVETWAFSLGLSKYLENPNALIFVGPDLSDWIKDPTPGNEQFINWEQPYPQIFCEEYIIYKKEFGVIFKLDQYEVRSEKGKLKYDQFLAVSMDGLILIRQIRPYKDDQDVFDVFTAPYPFLEYPVYTIGSVISEVEDDQIVYDSILTPCLPAWNDALFTNDDLLVNKALHSNPIFWRYKNSPCKTCNGSGLLSGKDNTQRTCSSCNGNGLGSEGSPFATIEINLQKKNATNPDVQYPTGPPAGYIQLDIAALEAQKKDIDDDIYRGFQAIGIELLANVPASQSGIAKQYDRKELNTFFFQVAVHLGSLIEEVSYACFLQRYRSEFDSRLLTTDQIQANKPKVVIPSDYDVLTTQVLSMNLADAIKNQFDPIITSGLTAQYTEKVFGENSYQVKILNIKSSIDPLPFMTGEEKLILKDSFGCTELDYITSAYLNSFVTELIEADNDWIKKPRAEQRADVKVLAIAKQKEIKSGMVTLMP